MKLPSAEAKLALLQTALPVVRDAAGLAGFAMVVHGAAMVYAPAGWIVGGLGLLASAVLLARKR